MEYPRMLASLEPGIASTRLPLSSSIENVLSTASLRPAMIRNCLMVRMASDDWRTVGASTRLLDSRWSISWAITTAPTNDLPD